MMKRLFLVAFFTKYNKSTASPISNQSRVTQLRLGRDCAQNTDLCLPLNHRWAEVRGSTSAKTLQAPPWEMKHDRMRSVVELFCFIGRNGALFRKTWQLGSQISERDKQDQFRFLKYYLSILGHDAEYLESGTVSDERSTSLSGCTNKQKFRF